MQALALDLLEQVAGVLAEHLNVYVAVDTAHPLLGGEVVLRLAGVGIEAQAGHHAADHGPWAQLMAQLDGQSAGHHLVMHGLIHDLVKVLAREAVRDQRAAGNGVAQHGVHLVEGEPVFDVLAKALKADAGVLDKEVDHLAGCPAVEVGHKGQRRVIVAQGDQRLNAVGLALLEHILVEGNALFVGLFVPGVGEDAAPADGGTEHLVAHLGHQGDILFIMVIEVGAMALGVVVLGAGLEGSFQVSSAVGKLLGIVRHTYVAVRQAVLNGHALAALVPGTLTLVSGFCAAPEKAFRESITCVFHSFYPFLITVSSLSPWRILPLSAAANTSR